jgi:ATP-dependent protease ClpP protease subunit
MSDRNRSRKTFNKKRKLEELMDLFSNKNNHNDDSDEEQESEDLLYEEGVTCRDNKIYFKTHVDDDNIEKLIKIIDSKNLKFQKLSQNRLFARVEPRPLYLHITSYGGDIFAAFRAIDCIKRSTIPIYTIIDGYAASAATLMSVVGKKRYMTPNAYVLIHQLSAGTFGKYWEMKDDFENYTSMMKDIYDLYVKNTKMSEDDLKQYLSHDIWWKSDRCLDTGIVDAIYERDDN